jgi:hypothetical protein
MSAVDNMSQAAVTPPANGAAGYQQEVEPSNSGRGEGRCVSCIWGSSGPVEAEKTSCYQ